jgi:hypothetical protein
VLCLFSVGHWCINLKLRKKGLLKLSKERSQPSESSSSRTLSWILKNVSSLETTNEVLRKELSTVTTDLDKVYLDIAKMKPIFDNIDEITEFLRERAWQKEQRARVQIEGQKQQEKELARKELGL